MPFIRPRHWFLLGMLGCVSALGACGSQAPSPGLETAGSGQLRFALLCATSEHQYRLRAGAFAIDGATRVTLDTESEPDSETLSTWLAPGPYSVTLSGDWYLERLDSAGPTRVAGELVSSNPATVMVDAGATTLV